MQDRWYYKTRSGVIGPLTNKELDAAFRDGVLTSESLVRHGIGGRFQPLSEAISHLSDETKGTREIASNVLTSMDRVVTSGGPVGAARTSLWGSLADMVGGLVGVLFWPLTSAWKWLRVYVGRKTLAALLLTAAGSLILRMIPTLDPPLSETHRKLAVIWERTRTLTAEPVDEAALSQFSNRTLPRLKEIAVMLERSHERRLGDNIWAMIRGRDEPTEKARLDLLRVAKYGLPTLLRSPGKAALRGPFIEEQLKRANQHLTTVGKSPYVTPTPWTPSAPPEPPRPADTAAHRGNRLWIKAVVGIDVLIMLAGTIWWWRRRKSPATSNM